MQVTFGVLGRLLVGSLFLSYALTVAARRGPHRLWSLAAFIGLVAYTTSTRLGEGVSILSQGMSGFTLHLSAIGLAAGATALTIQALRAWHTRPGWQIGAGAIAAETALLTGVGFWVY